MPFEVALYKVGETSYGAGSNEFGYTNRIYIGSVVKQSGCYYGQASRPTRSSSFFSSAADPRKARKRRWHENLNRPFSVLGER